MDGAALAAVSGFVNLVEVTLFPYYEGILELVADYLADHAQLDHKW